MKVYEFLTKDHPEAGGREPRSGEHAYTLTFPLERGETLAVRCGDATLQAMSEMIGSLLIDDAAEKI